MNQNNTLAADGRTNIDDYLLEGEETVLIAYPTWRWRSTNIGLLLFDVIWIAFFSFITFVVLEDDAIFPIIFMIPFWMVAIGIPFGIWWNRKRMRHTTYVLTNQRAMVLRPNLFMSRVLTLSWPLSPTTVKSIKEYDDGSGDIVMGYKDYQVNDQPVPDGFISVPEIHRVNQILQEQIAAVSANTPAQVVVPPQTSTPTFTAPTPAQPRPQQARKRIPRWAAIFFLPQAILLVCVGIFLVQEEEELDARGITTTATIVHINQHDEAPNPTLKFTDTKGKEQRVTSSYGSTSYKHLQPGSQVQVIYLPNNPESVRIGTCGDPFLGYALMFGGTLCGVIGLCILICGGDKKKNNPQIPANRE